MANGKTSMGRRRRKEEGNNLNESCSSTVFRGKEKGHALGREWETIWTINSEQIAARYCWAFCLLLWATYVSPSLCSSLLLTACILSGSNLDTPSRALGAVLKGREFHSGREFKNRPACKQFHKFSSTINTDDGGTAGSLWVVKSSGRDFLLPCSLPPKGGQKVWTILCRFELSDTNVPLPPACALWCGVQS